MKINNYVELKESKIHHKGVFAITDIPANTEIIEYTGNIISKDEAEKIMKACLEKSKKDKTAGGVYMFDLENGTFLDGDIENNPAKYINHSCSPNCECEVKTDKVIIKSIKPIKKSEELSFNYSFDLEEDFHHHPCYCNSHNCVGYIVAEEHWPKLKEKIKTKS